MTDHTEKLLEGLRPSDAACTAQVFPLSLRSRMLAEITAETPSIAGAADGNSGFGQHRPSRREKSGARRRPVAAGMIGLTTALACATLAIVLGAGSAVAPTTAEAVSFRATQSGYTIAAVTEPFATRARLNAAFAKHGMPIRIQLFPVSPSAVGKVIYMALSNTHGPQIESLRQGNDCVSQGGACSIGIRIPAGFTARATIGLGRPAKPGEIYASSASAFAPGEILHCSGLLGATVARALPILSHDKLTARWMEDIEIKTRHSGVSSRAWTLASPPTHNYIWEATLSAQGQITIQTEAKPWHGTPVAGAHRGDGC